MTNNQPFTHPHPLSSSSSLSPPPPSPTTTHDSADSIPSDINFAALRPPLLPFHSPPLPLHPLPRPPPSPPPLQAHRALLSTPASAVHHPCPIPVRSLWPPLDRWLPWPIAEVDLRDSLLMSICAALVSVDNRALCPKEIAQVVFGHGWASAPSAQPFALISASIRSHLRRHDPSLREPCSAVPPLLSSYQLVSSPSRQEELCMGIVKDSKAQIKRSTLWFLNPVATGFKDPFTSVPQKGVRRSDLLQSSGTPPSEPLSMVPFHDSQPHQPLLTTASPGSFLIKASPPSPFSNVLVCQPSVGVSTPVPTPPLNQDSACAVTPLNNSCAPPPSANGAGIKIKLRFPATKSSVDLTSQDPPIKPLLKLKLNPPACDHNHQSYRSQCYGEYVTLSPARSAAAGDDDDDDDDDEEEEEEDGDGDEAEPTDNDDAGKAEECSRHMSFRSHDVSRPLRLPPFGRVGTERADSPSFSGFLNARHSDPSYVPRRPFSSFLCNGNLSLNPSASQRASSSSSSTVSNEDYSLTDTDDMVLVQGDQLGLECQATDPDEEDHPSESDGPEDYAELMTVSRDEDVPCVQAPHTDELLRGPQTWSQSCVKWVNGMVRKDIDPRRECRPLSAMDTSFETCTSMADRGFRSFVCPFPSSRAWDASQRPLPLSGHPTKKPCENSYTDGHKHRLNSPQRFKVSGRRRISEPYGAQVYDLHSTLFVEERSRSLSASEGEAEEHLRERESFLDASVRLRLNSLHNGQDGQPSRPFHNVGEVVDVDTSFTEPMSLMEQVPVIFDEPTDSSSVEDDSAFDSPVRPDDIGSLAHSRITSRGSVCAQEECHDFSTLSDRLTEAMRADESLLSEAGDDARVQTHLQTVKPNCWKRMRSLSVRTNQIGSLADRLGFTSLCEARGRCQSMSEVGLGRSRTDWRPEDDRNQSLRPDRAGQSVNLSSVDQIEAKEHTKENVEMQGHAAPPESRVTRRKGRFTKSVVARKRRKVDKVLSKQRPPEIADQDGSIPHTRKEAQLCSGVGASEAVPPGDVNGDVEVVRPDMIQLEELDRVWEFTDDDDVGGKMLFVEQELGSQKRCCWSGSCRCKDSSRAGQERHQVIKLDLSGEGPDECHRRLDALVVSEETLGAEVNNMQVARNEKDQARSGCVGGRGVSESVFWSHKEKDKKEFLTSASLPLKNWIQDKEASVVLPIVEVAGTVIKANTETERVRWPSFVPGAPAGPGELRDWSGSEPSSALIVGSVRTLGGKIYVPLAETTQPLFECPDRNQDGGGDDLMQGQERKSVIRMTNRGMTEAGRRFAGKPVMMWMSSTTMTADAGVDGGDECYVLMMLDCCLDGGVRQKRRRTMKKQLVVEQSSVCRWSKEKSYGAASENDKKGDCCGEKSEGNRAGGNSKVPGGSGDQSRRKDWVLVKNQRKGLVHLMSFLGILKFGRTDLLSWSLLDEKLGDALRDNRHYPHQQHQLEGVTVSTCVSGDAACKEETTRVGQDDGDGEMTEGRTKWVEWVSVDSCKTLVQLVGLVEWIEPEVVWRFLDFC